LAAEARCLYAQGDRRRDGLIACGLLAYPGRSEGAASEALGNVGRFGPRLKAGAPGTAGLFFEPHSMALAAPLPTGAVTFAFTDIEGRLQP